MAARNLGLLLVQVLIDRESWRKDQFTCQNDGPDLILNLLKICQQTCTTPNNFFFHLWLLIAPKTDELISKQLLQAACKGDRLKA